MMNGTYIKMNNIEETRTFFVFDDGTAKELKSFGWSELINDFLSVYRNLKNNGYIEIE